MRRSTPPPSSLRSTTHLPSRPPPAPPPAVPTTRSSSSRSSSSLAASASARSDTSSHPSASANSSAGTFDNLWGALSYSYSLFSGRAYPVAEEGEGGWEGGGRIRGPSRRQQSEGTGETSLSSSGVSGSSSSASSSSLSSSEGGRGGAFPPFFSSLRSPDASPPPPSFTRLLNRSRGELCLFCFGVCLVLYLVNWVWNWILQRLLLYLCLLWSLVFCFRLFNGRSTGSPDPLLDALAYPVGVGRFVYRWGWRAWWDMAHGGRRVPRSRSGVGAADDELAYSYLQGGIAGRRRSRRGSETGSHSRTPENYVSQWAEGEDVPSEILCRKELQRFECPITHDVFKEPVVAADGFTYERSAIEAWIAARLVEEEGGWWGGKVCSPMTGRELGHLWLVPNYTHQAMVTQYLHYRKQTGATDENS